MKYQSTKKFKQVIKSLKEQGKIDDDVHIALSKQIKKLDHAIVVKNNDEIAKAVAKLSYILWDATR